MDKKAKHPVDALDHLVDTIFKPVEALLGAKPKPKHAARPHPAAQAAAHPAPTASVEDKAKLDVVKHLKAAPHGIVRGPSLAEDEWFQRQDAERARKKGKA